MAAARATRLDGVNTVGSQDLEQTILEFVCYKAAYGNALAGDARCEGAASQTHGADQF